MKKILSLILCAVLSVSCFSTVCAYEEVEKKTYIVELSAPAVYSPDRVMLFSVDDGAYRNELLELQSQIKSQIDGGVSLFSVRSAERTYTYTDVLNGFTVNADKATAERIKNIEGVLNVYEDERVEISEPVKSESDEEIAVTEMATGESVQRSVANSSDMLNVQSAYDKGYNGEGRAVAIIDSAINPNHIYYRLSDDGSAKYTQSEISSILSNNTMNVSASGVSAYRSAKIPFAFNYPQNSSSVTASNLHGAHVAGIVAGNSVEVSDGVIQGVAPEAQILFFGMYSPEGTMASDIVAALEDAVKFDVDAINISMGTDYASENMSASSAYKSAIAACRNAGKTVVIAAGNTDRMSYSAQMSDYGTSDNRSHPYSVKVGSVQSEFAYMNYLEDENGNKYPCVAKGRTSALGGLSVADCGSGSQAEITAAQVSGKIALISMPDTYVASGVSVYASRARNAGAAAVVVGYTSNDLPDGNSNYAYSLFTVSRDSAEEIRKNAKTLKYTNQMAVVQRENAPRENAYSSYGYADNLDISVDYAAPGGNVYSSYSGTSGFANLSGTSMATPHITGATSLMYQYVEEKFPAYTGASKVQLVKNLLASTAETVYAENGATASPRKVGSGLIRLDRAMETNIILKGNNSEETRINLGADLTKTFYLRFRAQNIGNTPITLNGANVEISADDYKYYDGRDNGYYGRKKLTATVSGWSGISVPAGGSRNVTLRVTLDDSEIAYLQKAMTNGFFIDGKVTLSGDGNCDVGIPFSGFYGDWAKLSVMNEKRILDYLSVFGVSDDGFTPNALITKGESGPVMPISDSVDETVSGLSVAMKANPLRNAYITVKLDEKTVLSNAFINKEREIGYYLGYETLGDLSDVSEITIEFRLPYYTTTTKNQKSVIKIVKDNTPPVISDIYVSSDGRKAYLDVSDEYGVSVVSAYGMVGEEWQEEHKYIKKESSTAEFNISGLSELNYFVYDCAFNMTSSEPHIGIDVKDGKAVFTNNTHTPIGGDCMIAVYENGKMTKFLKLSGENFVMEAYDAKKYDLSAYEGTDYKLFFWSNEDGVIPLCGAYSVME